MVGRTRITKTALTALRKRQPRGFRKLAKGRYELKSKETIAETSISEFLSGKFSNDILLSVLVEIAEENEAQVRTMSLRARGKRKSEQAVAN